MPELTTNYGLAKPLAATETYDINVPNGNMDIIDTQMKILDDAIKVCGAGAIIGIDLRSADYTIAEADYLKKLIVVTHGSSTYAIIAPSTSNHRYIVVNNDTSKPVTIKKSGGAGVNIAPNSEAVVRYDGDDYTKTHSEPTGKVAMFAGMSAPGGWLICDGSAVSRSDYAALFGVIGTTYGIGDGATTFNLPDLQGRVPVGKSATDSDFDVLGETGGEKAHSLTEAENGTHTHVQNSHNHTQNSHNHTQDAHTHMINHNHGAVTSGSQNKSHTHYVSDTSSSNGSHNHTQNPHNHVALYMGSNGAGKWPQATGQSNVGVQISGTAGKTYNNILTYGQTATNNAAGSHAHTWSDTSGNQSQSHQHTVDLPNYSGNSGSKTATNNATTAVNNAATATNQNSGDGTAHNNLQPYTVVNYIIKT